MPREAIKIDAFTPYGRSVNKNLKQPRAVAKRFRCYATSGTGDSVFTGLQFCRAEQSPRGFPCDLMRCCAAPAGH